MELISLYKSLLAKQRAELAENKTRLENGVEKIAQAARQVADLQVRISQDRTVTARSIIRCRHTFSIVMFSSIKFNFLSVCLQPAHTFHDGQGLLSGQVALKEETIIVEEKKAATQTLIESIGQEKAVVDAAVESSRGDEEAAAALQVSWPHRCMMLSTPMPLQIDKSTKEHQFVAA